MKLVILVVDDDRVMGELFSDVFGVYVFEVFVSQIGNDVLMMVVQWVDIVLVLLDMILLDIYGLQVFQQLQCMWFELLVVMFFGLGSEFDVVVGLEMGVDDYIVKLFSLWVVVVWVKVVL